jgi:CBS domain-containing protein
MATVREIMTTDPIVLQSSTSVKEAAQTMRDADVGDVIVEDGGSLVGVVTDRDIAIRCVAEGTSPDSATIWSIVSDELHTLSPDASLDDAVEVMREAAVRRVPVVEDGVAIGVVSLGDLAVAKDPDSVLADISASHGNA